MHSNSDETPTAQPMPDDKQAGLVALAERVEALREDDIRVECNIFAIVHPEKFPVVGEAQHYARADVALNRADFSFLREMGMPRYTASLDAAMGLVPEGCREWHAGKHFKTGQGQAYILPAIVLPDPIYCLAPTPALALTAAALRARALAQQEGGQ